MRKQHRQTRSLRHKAAKPRKARPAATSATPELASSAVRSLTPASPPTAPSPPARKPRFHEAVALYEGAVRLLQRHEFGAAAEQFRSVIIGYPEERELLERARLYLRVCERETSQRPGASPRTPEEHVYAATMALNAGELQAAIGYLRQALQENPDHDHGHYIMAVALLEAGDADGALAHLQRSIRLNPDNLSLARQDPDLEGLRAHEGFHAAIAALRAGGAQGERKARRR